MTTGDATKEQKKRERKSVVWRKKRTNRRMGTKAHTVLTLLMNSQLWRHHIPCPCPFFWYFPLHHDKKDKLSLLTRHIHPHNRTQKYIKTRLKVNWHLKGTYSIATNWFLAVHACYILVSVSITYFYLPFPSFIWSSFSFQSCAKNCWINV